MKTLYDYILEAREYFNPDISLNDVRKIFDFIANDGFFNDMPDDLVDKFSIYSVNPKVMFDIISAYYYSKSGMHGKVTDEGCKKFLKMIRKQPLERIKRILGAGGEGMVYDLGNNRVLKILFDTDWMGCNLQTIETMKRMIGKKFETLPQIYKVTKNFIIRENCKPNTPRVKRFHDIATKKQFHDDKVSYENLVAGGHSDKALVMARTKEEKDVINWLIRCCEELRSVGYNPGEDGINTIGDFRPANLGETKDGRIIYFDWRKDCSWCFKR